MTHWKWLEFKGIFKMNTDKNKVKVSTPAPGSTGGSKPFLNIGATLSLGAGIGLVLGLLLNNLVLWMMIGTGIGFWVGAVLEGANQRRSKPPEDAPRK